MPRGVETPPDLILFKRSKQKKLITKVLVILTESAVIELRKFPGDVYKLRVIDDDKIVESAVSLEALSRLLDFLYKELGVNYVPGN